MKIHAFILALGSLVGASAVAQAQEAQLPPGPLEALQDDFGKVVGFNFHVPDPIVNAPAAVAPDAPGPTLGKAFRGTLEVPGAVFAGMFQPFAAADAAAAPAPAAATPAPRHHRHGRVHRQLAPGAAG